jgi:hypothetical protein
MPRSCTGFMPAKASIPWNSLPVWLLFGLLCAACSANGDQIFTIDSVAFQAQGGSVSAGGAGRSGNSAQGGASGQGGGALGVAAGSSSAHLNPNVTFGWTETSPGRGSCAGQTFVGNFTCTVSPVLFSPNVEGSLMLAFGGSLENQPLTLTDGQLVAFDDGNAQLLMAPLTGKLDCGSRIATLDLTPTMTDVLPLTRQIAWVLPMAQPMATGTLHGNFDASALTINGDVALAFADTQTKCLGKFIVQAIR